jgi:hypothetical protein
LEFSSKAEGGTRSLNGCKIRGGKSQTVSPRVFRDVDMVLKLYLSAKPMKTAIGLPIHRE